MKFLFINHHLYQDGDTYGLIYSLLLNEAFCSTGGDDTQIFGLFWINADDTSLNTKIETRKGYFRSFGLIGTRVCLVRCHFRDDVRLIRVELDEDNNIAVTANAQLFNSNPRLVSAFVTRGENLMPLRQWLQNMDHQLEEKLGYARFAARSLHMNEYDLEPQRVISFMKHYSSPEFGSSHSVQDVQASLGGWKSYQYSLSQLLCGQGDAQFSYIDKSTDTIRDYVNNFGFSKVTAILRNRVLDSTVEFTDGNHEFMNHFMKGYLTKKSVKLSEHERPVVILFWIRSAKREEARAIQGDKQYSVGKPQHHTNMVLYKHVRHIVRSVKENIRAPIFFIPIGDELEESTIKVSGAALEHAARTLGISLSSPLTLEAQNQIEKYLKSRYSYTDEDLSSTCALFAKNSAPHNLIKFFEREPFQGRPMGAQINFLLQLSMNFNVIQIGMRSGSMERLMYLGVPTIYFDRTEKIEGLDTPVGHERIKQLCAFKGKTKTDLLRYFGTCQSYLTGNTNKASGYPLFFQIENIDTGYIKYFSQKESRVKKQIERLSSQQNTYAYLSFQQKISKKNILQLGTLSLYEQKSLEFGGLQATESEKLEFMIWFICEISPCYNDLIGGVDVKTRLVSNQYSQQLNNELSKQRNEDFEKRKERAVKGYKHRSLPNPLMNDIHRRRRD